MRSYIDLIKYLYAIKVRPGSSQTQCFIFTTNITTLKTTS